MQQLILIFDLCIEKEKDIPPKGEVWNEIIVVNSFWVLNKFTMVNSFWVLNEFTMVNSFGVLKRVYNGKLVLGSERVNYADQNLRSSPF